MIAAETWSEYWLGPYPLAVGIAINAVTLLGLLALAAAGLRWAERLSWRDAWIRAALFLSVGLVFVTFVEWIGRVS